MLVATKSEIAAVIALLNSPTDAKGQAWTEDTMGRALINLVTEMREERKTFGVVFELTPGVYIGYGPYATEAAARKAVPKIPMAQVTKRGAVFPVYGHSQAEAAYAKSDEPLPERSDFTIAREDAACFRRGWKGNVRDRDQYLPIT